MRVRLVRRPGQHGTKAYVEQYGDRLVCVRYRYDEAAHRRYKTIEIIVDEAPWEAKEKGREKPRHCDEALIVARTQYSEEREEPRYRGETLIGVRTRYSEDGLRSRLRGIGAAWLPQLRMWVLTYDQAIDLGLTERIAGTIAELAASR